MDTPFEVERHARKSGWANGVVKTLGFELGGASCDGSGSDESVGAEAFTASALQLAYALKGLSVEGAADVGDPDTPIGLPSHVDPSKRTADAFCKSRLRQRFDSCQTQSPRSDPGSPHTQGRPQALGASNPHCLAGDTQGCGIEAGIGGGDALGDPSLAASPLHVLPDEERSPRVPDHECFRTLPDQEHFNASPDQACVQPATGQPSQPSCRPGATMTNTGPPLPNPARGSHMSEAGEGAALVDGTGEHAEPDQARGGAGDLTEPVLASEGLLKEHLFEVLVQRVVPANARLSASASSTLYVKYLMPGEGRMHAKLDSLKQDKL